MSNLRRYYRLVASWQEINATTKLWQLSTRHLDLGLVERERARRQWKRLYNELDEREDIAWLRVDFLEETVNVNRHGEPTGKRGRPELLGTLPDYAGPAIDVAAELASMRERLRCST